MRESQAIPDISTAMAIAVSGASGRMGRLLLDAAAQDGRIAVIAAWVGAGSAKLGDLLDGMPALRYTPLGEAGIRRVDCVVDFTRADAFNDVLAWCLNERVALVSGTTGLSARQHAALSDAGQTIPVLWSANFSPGVAVLNRAAAEAARTLSGWDVEIVEAHHAGKRDAPSGTALWLGRTVAGARGVSLDDHAVHDRGRVSEPRRTGDIGFSAVRAGDIVGEHTVILAAAGERLELSHRATDRGIFARGALHAARWVIGRAPGLYHFEDSLD